MSELLDTSVLVAAFVGTHVNHAPSLAALARSAKTTSYCSAHSLAEVYSVLTRLPVRPRIGAAQALAYLEEVRGRLTIVSLDESGYFETLEAAAASEVRGGQIFDALLLRCARITDVDTILTWNVSHFQRIAPDLAAHIATP